MRVPPPRSPTVLIPPVPGSESDTGHDYWTQLQSPSVSASGYRVPTAAEVEADIAAVQRRAAPPRREVRLSPTDKTRIEATLSGALGRPVNATVIEAAAPPAKPFYVRIAPQ